MKKSIFVLLALIPLFMGCKEITLSMDDSGKTITVAPGTTIKITLVSNRSTGNIWHNINYDKALLKQVGEPVYEKSKGGLVGAPGKVTYTFKALQSGETNLRMDYGSIHSDNKDSLKEFNIRVVVK